MSYFTSDFHLFFKELAANNNKNWMDANRKRYEKEIKQPFHTFVSDFYIWLEENNYINFEVDYRKCMFRINRDIRFSNNKMPYNMHCSAIFAPKGKKDSTSAGFYIQFSPGQNIIGGGVYKPDKLYLERCRRKIVREPNRLDLILNDKIIKTTFDSLWGEKNKRINKEFISDNTPELTYNKQWFLSTTFEDESFILEGDVLQKVKEYYLKIHPFLEYFNSEK